MKVLALLLGAIAITEASHWAKVKREAEELRNTVDCAENNIQTFDGEFGVMRKIRLQKIADHFRKRTTNQSDADEEAIKLFSQNFVPVDMSSSLPAQDPNTINEAAGISDFLFQGDIHFTDEQLDAIEQQLADTDEDGRSKRQVSSIFKKWTNNRVYYYFQSSSSARMRAAVKYGLTYIQSRTCLVFQESSTAANRVKVYPGSGCHSTIGMAGGEQELSLGNLCTISGTVIHEFMHALGVWHMHMRSDRDSYVSINLGVVEQARRYNFDKLKTNDNINYTPYEYGSCMHYGANAFTNEKAISIVPRDSAYLYTMGGSIASFYDIDMINEHYGCNAKCPKSSICKNGGKPNPANCNICNCPAGYGGNYCDQRPSGCGEVLTATSTWKNQTIRLGDFDNTKNRDVADMCNYWITAPAGYKIELKVTSMFNPQCQHGCKFNGLEFKTDNQQATNPRICCQEFFNKTYKSKLNPTPVMLFNHYFYTDFNFSYRTVSGTAAEPAIGRLI